LKTKFFKNFTGPEKTAPAPADNVLFFLPSGGFQSHSWQPVFHSETAGPAGKAQKGPSEIQNPAALSF
jgi:hypothetical protein